MKRRSFLTGAMATAGAVAAPSYLRAQSAPVELVLSSWAPDHNTVPRDIVMPWAETIAEFTRGRVVVRKLDKPVGPPPVHLDALRSGKIDLCYSGPSAFPRAKIGQFSFLGDSYGTSLAFSQVYSGPLNADDEHDDIKLLGLFTHGPGQIFLRGEPVRRPQDMRGLRIRTSGGYISTLIEQMGGVPVAMPPGVVGDAMSRGELDGVCFPYEAPPSFGTLPHIRSATEFPGGLYNSTFFLAMSRAKWNMISPADQRLIDEVTAEVISVSSGKGFDLADHMGLELAKQQGMQIERASNELIDFVKSKGDVLENDWIAEVSAQGYDSADALAQLRYFTNARHL